MIKLRHLATCVAVAGLAAVFATSARAHGPTTWSGVYFGASAGWSGSEVDWAFNPAIGGAANQAYSFSDDDAVLGAHIGYQHQMGNLVLGVEAGYMQTLDDGSRRALFGNNAAFDSEVEIDGIFTIGGRLGYTPMSNVLLYATGGFATAEIESRAITVATGAVAFAAQERHNGWYAGVGVDYAISPNVVVGIEYQHISLGTERHCPDPTCPGAGGGFVDRDIDAEIDVVKARVSFKFGDRPAPAPLK